MLETPSTTPCTVRVYMNTDPDSFLGYAGHHWVCTDPDLLLTVQARSPRHAADLAFAIGNRQGADALGRTWPIDVRSVSVGDLMAVRDVYDRVTLLAVAGSDFKDPGLTADQLWITELAGSSRVTSR